MDANVGAARSALLYRSLAALLIVGTAIVRIVYLGWWSPLDLAPDEAHYWDWSRHLDWSYYSKGPLVALLIRGSLEIFGSLSLAWTGSEMLAVRLPAVFSGALLLTALYVLTARVHRRESWALAVVGIALTLPVVAAGSTLMTIDAPFLCLWAWALVTAHAAVFRGQRWAWPATGLFIAGGLLAKHTMILWLPCFGLFLLLTPTVRPLLLRPGFWIAAGIGLCGAVPIIAWNSANEWVTLRHTQGHAGLTNRQLIHWMGPLFYVGTQFALLLGFWFVAWLQAAVRYQPLREPRSDLRFLWWMSVPILVFFGVFSLKNGGGEPNWPVAGYLSGAVLLVGWFAEAFATSGPVRRFALGFGIGCVGLLGLIGTILIHDPVHFQPVFAFLAGPKTNERPMPLRRFDPTCRLRGWQTVGHVVDAELARQRAAGREPLLAATSWALPGEVGFYTAGHPTVYSFGPALGDRHSQYDLWHPNPLADPAAFLGKSFLVVGADAASLKRAFAEVEPTRIVEYREGDQLIAVWPITVGHGYRGFLTSERPNGY